MPENTNDTIKLKVELDTGDAIEQFDNIAQANERVASAIQKTQKAVKDVLPGFEDYFNQAQRATSLSQERITSIDGMLNSDDVDSYRKQILRAERESSIASMSAVYKDMMQIQGLSKELKELNKSKLNISKDLTKLFGFANQAMHVFEGVGDLASDTQIVSAMKQLKGVEKIIGGWNGKISDKTTDALLHSVVMRAVPQYQRGSFMQNIIKDGSTSRHMFDSFQEMLPRSMQGINARLIEKNTKYTALNKDDFRQLTSQEMKTVYSLLRNNQQFANAAESLGMATRRNGDIYALNGITRGMMKYAAGNLFNQLVNAAKGMEMYGVTDVNDVESWDKVARKSNKRLIGSLNASRLLSDQMDWLTAETYSDEDIKKMQSAIRRNKSGQQEFIRAGKIKYAPTPNSYQVARYSIDKLDEPFEHFAVDESLHLNQIMSHGGGIKAHNSSIDDVIYLAIDERLQDPTLDKEVRKQIEAKYADIFQHGIPGKGRNGKSDPYVFTRINPKSGVEFVRKSVVDKIKKNDPYYFSAGLDQETFSDWEDYAKAMEYRNKNATPGVDIKKLYGTDLSGIKVAVVDLEKSTRQHEGNTEDKAATGAGLNGASIISNKLVQQGIQARAHGIKTALTVADIQALSKQYGGSLRLTAATGKLGDDGKIAYGSEGTIDVSDADIIVNASDLKTFNRFKGKSNEEITKIVRDDIMRHSIYAKTTYGDANKKTRWFSGQLAQILNMDPRASAMFAQAWLDEYGKAGTYQGALDTVFADNTEMRDLLVSKPGLWGSKAVQSQVESYRESLLKRMSQGDIFIPEGINAYKGMIAPWLVDTFNADMRHTHEWDKLSEERQKYLSSLEMGDNRALFMKTLSKRLGIGRYPATGRSMQGVVNASDNKRLMEFAKNVGLDPSGLYVSTTSPLMQLIQDADFDGDVAEIIELENLMNDRSSTVEKVFNYVVEATMRRNNELFKDNPEERDKRNKALRRTVQSKGRFSTNTNTKAGALNAAKFLSEAALSNASMGVPNATVRNAFQMRFDSDVIKAMDDAEAQYSDNSTRYKKGIERLSSNEQRQILGRYKPFSEMFHMVNKARDEDTGEVSYEKLAGKNFFAVNIPSQYMSGSMRAQMLARYVAKNQRGYDINKGYDWEKIFNAAHGEKDTSTAVGRMQAGLRDLYTGLLNADYLAPSNDTVIQLLQLRKAAEDELTGQYEEKIRNGELVLKGKQTARGLAEKDLGAMGGTVIGNLLDYALTENNVGTDNNRRWFGEMTRIYGDTIGRPDLSSYLTAQPVAVEDAIKGNAKAQKLVEVNENIKALSVLNQKQLRNKLDNLSFSPTMLSKILKNPIEWAEQYLSGKEYVANAHTVLGDAAHYAIEEFMKERQGAYDKQGIISDEDYDTLSSKAVANFEDYLYGRIPKNKTEDVYGKGKYKKRGLLPSEIQKLEQTGSLQDKYNAIKGYLGSSLRTLYPVQDYEYVGSEDWLNLPLGKKDNGEDIVSNGRYDLAFRNRRSGHLTIADIKTHGGQIDTDEMAAILMQQAYYAKAAPEFFGKKPGFEGAKVEAMDLILPSQDRIEHLDASPEVIEKNYQGLQEAVKLIQSLSETGINTQSLNALQESLKAIFGVTESESNAIAKRAVEINKIQEQVSKSDGAGFGGALMAQRDYDDAMEQLSDISSFAWKQRRKEGDHFNQWAHAYDTVANQESTISMLEAQQMNAQAINLRRETERQAKNLDAILPEAAVNNLQKMYDNLHNFNTGEIASKEATGGAEYFQTITDQIKTATDAYTALQSKIENGKYELAKLKEDLDSTPKESQDKINELNGKISEKETQLKIDEKNFDIADKEKKKMDLESEKFKERYNKQTWDQLNKQAEEIGAIQSGKTTSGMQDVSEQMQDYIGRIKQQIGNAKAFADAGVIDSNSDQYKNYISDLQSRMSAKNMTDYRHRIINESMTNFERREAKTFADVDHLAWYDEALDELNIRQAVEDKRKQIDQDKADIQKRFEKTSLNSVEKERLRNLLNAYDWFDESKYEEQIREEVGFRRKQNNASDMQLAAQQLGIFKNNDDIIKQTNRTKALLQFEQLQRRIRKKDPGTLSDIEQEYLGYTNEDFLKKYDERVKRQEDNIKRRNDSATNIANMQQAYQAERFGDQLDQQMMQWNARGSNDMFTRGYLQRYSMYNQFKNMEANAGINIAHLEESRRQYESIFNDETRDQSERDNAQERIKGIDESLQHYKDSLDKAREAKKQFEGKDGQFSQSMNMWQASVDGVAQSMDRLLQRFGRQMFQKAFQEAKNFVVQFDSQMRNIQAITLKTDEQMETLRKNTIDTAIELKTSVGNVAQVEADLYRQGLNDQQVEERAGAIIKFASVTGAKVTDAGKAITTAIQNGLVENAEQAMDVMTALGDNAATTAEQIFKGMQKSAAAAKVAGVSYEELTTMLTIGTSKTQLSGQVLGTGLQTIFSRMNRVTNEGYYNDETGATTTINDVEKALKSAGIQLRTDDGKSFRNSFEVLRDLSKVWGGLNDLQRSNITYTMAGGRQQNIFQSLMEGMAEDGGLELERLLGLAKDSEGVTESKYEVVAKSITASINELKSTYDGLIESFADNSVIVGTVDLFTSILSGFRDLSDAAPNLVTALMVAGTAFTAFAMKVTVSNAVMKTSAAGFAGLISTLGAIAAGLAVGSIFGGIGSLWNDANEAGDVNKQNQKQIDKANSFYEAQKERTKTLKSQISEVEKLGEAWEKAGKPKEGTEAADALKSALSGLDGTLGSLSGSFEQNATAIANWKNAVRDGQNIVKTLSLDAAQVADEAKDVALISAANDMFKDYKGSQIFKDTGSAWTNSILKNLARKGSDITTNSPINRIKELAESGESDDVLLTALNSDIAIDNLVPYSYGLGVAEAYKNATGETFKDKSASILSALEEASAIEYFGKALTGGRFKNEAYVGGEEEKEFYKQIKEGFINSPQFAQWLNKNQGLYKNGEFNFGIGDAAYENVKGLYKVYEGYMTESAPRTAKVSDEKLKSDTKNIVTNALKQSSALDFVFGGNSELISKAIEAATKDLKPEDLQTSDAILQYVQKTRQSIVDKYTGKSAEWLNQTLNPSEYKQQITYTTKDGETVTFGTNKIVTNEAEAMLQAEEHLKEGEGEKTVQASMESLSTTVDSASTNVSTAVGELVTALGQVPSQIADAIANLLNNKEDKVPPEGGKTGSSTEEAVQGYVEGDRPKVHRDISGEQQAETVETTPKSYLRAMTESEAKRSKMEYDAWLRYEARGYYGTELEKHGIKSMDDVQAYIDRLYFVSDYAEKLNALKQLGSYVGISDFILEQGNVYTENDRKNKAGFSYLIPFIKAVYADYFNGDLYNEVAKGGGDWKGYIDDEAEKQRMAAEEAKKAQREKELASKREAQRLAAARARQQLEQEGWAEQASKDQLAATRALAAQATDEDMQLLAQVDEEKKAKVDEIIENAAGKHLPISVEQLSGQIAMIQKAAAENANFLKEFIAENYDMLTENFGDLSSFKVSDIYNNEYAIGPGFIKAKKQIVDANKIKNNAEIGINPKQLETENAEVKNKEAKNKEAENKEKTEARNKEVENEENATPKAKPEATETTGTPETPANVQKEDISDVKFTEVKYPKLSEVVDQATQNATKQDLTQQYRSLMAESFQVENFKALNDAIKDGSMYAGLFANDPELRKIAADLSQEGGPKKYNFKNFQDQLEKGLLGYTLLNRIPIITSNTDNYNKQAAAANAVQNGNATDEQYAMIAQQFGIDQYTLRSKRDVYGTLAKRQQDYAKAQLEQNAETDINTLMESYMEGMTETEFNHYKDMADYSNKNLADIIWENFVGQSSNQEYLNSVMSAYKESGYSFSYDNGRIKATLADGTPHIEDILNPDQWNRSVSRTQQLADVKAYLDSIDSGTLVEPPDEKRRAALKAYSSDMEQYINLTDEARKGTEGLRLLQNIRLQVAVDGLDELAKLGQMSQEAVTWATQLSTGGTLKFDALKSIRSYSYNVSQLAGALNAENRTADMDQAIMSYMQLSGEQYYGNEDKYLKELRSELESDEYITSMQNNYTKALEKAPTGADRLRIANEIKNLGGTINKDRTVTFGQDWYKNLRYNQSNPFESNGRAFNSPSSVKSAVLDILDNNFNAQDIEYKYNKDMMSDINSYAPGLAELLNTTDEKRKKELEIEIRTNINKDELQELLKYGQVLENIEKIQEGLKNKGTVKQLEGEAAQRKDEYSTMYEAFVMQQISTVGYDNLSADMQNYVKQKLGLDGRNFENLPSGTVIENMFMSKDRLDILKQQRINELNDLLENGANDNDILALGASAIRSNNNGTRTVQLDDDWYKYMTYNQDNLLKNYSRRYTDQEVENTMKKILSGETTKIYDEVLRQQLDNMFGAENIDTLFREGAFDETKQAAREAIQKAIDLRGYRAKEASGEISSGMADRAENILFGTKDQREQAIQEEIANINTLKRYSGLIAAFSNGELNGDRSALEELFGLTGATSIEDFDIANARTIVGRRIAQAMTFANALNNAEITEQYRTEQYGIVKTASDFLNAFTNRTDNMQDYEKYGLANFYSNKDIANFANELISYVESGKTEEAEQFIDKNRGLYNASQGKYGQDYYSNLLSMPINTDEFNSAMAEIQKNIVRDMFRNDIDFGRTIEGTEGYINGLLSTDYTTRSDTQKQLNDWMQQHNRRQTLTGMTLEQLRNDNEMMSAFVASTTANSAADVFTEFDKYRKELVETVQQENEQISGMSKILNFIDADFAKEWSSKNTGKGVWNKLSPIDTYMPKLTTSETLDYVNQIISAGENAEQVYKGFDSNIQQQLQNFPDLLQYIATYGKDSEKANEAMKNLNKTIRSETIKALEEEGKVISGLSGQLETIVNGNVIDQVKQMNQLTQSLTDITDAYTAFDKAIKGTAGSEDWDIIQSMLGFNDQRRSEYILGRRDLNTDYGNMWRGRIGDLQKQTMETTAEAIITSQLKESDLYRETVVGNRGLWRTITDTFGFTKPETKKTRKSLEDIVSGMTEEQINAANQSLAAIGARIEDGKIVYDQEGLKTNKPTASQRYQVALAMYGGDEAEDMRTLYENLIGENLINGGMIAYRASTLKKQGALKTDAAEKLFESEEFIEAASRGDTQAIMNMLFQGAYGRQKTNLTKMNEAQSYIDDLLKEGAGTEEANTINNLTGDIKDFIFSIEGVQEAVDILTSGGTLNEYQKKAIRGATAYAAMQEEERAETYRQGTADLTKTLITGTWREQQQALTAFTENRDNLIKTDEAITHILAHQGENNEIYWDQIKESQGMNDKQIDYYKQHLQDLEDLQSRIQGEKDLMNSSLEAAIASALNIGNFDELAEAGNSALLAAAKKMLNLSGLDVDVDRNGASIVEDNRTPWEILNDVSGKSGYNTDKEIKRYQSEFAKMIADSEDIEQFQEAYEQSDLAKQNQGFIEKVLGRDWGTMLSKMLSGEYKWNEIQNSFMQASGYSPFYKNTEFENNYARAQELFGQNLGYSNFITANNLNEVMQLMSEGGAYENVGKFFESIQGGSEVLQELRTKGIAAGDTVKTFNENFNYARTKDINKYKDNTEEVANTVKNLGLNARSSVQTVGSLINKMSQLNNQFTAAQKSRGKSGKELDSKTKGLLSSATGISDADIKEMTLEELDSIASMVEQAAEEEFSTSIANPIAEQAAKTISEALANQTITIPELINFDVNGDGNYDMTELAALAERLNDTALSTLASYAGPIADLVLQYAAAGDKLSVSAVLNSLKGGGKGGGGGGGGGGKKSAAQELLEKIKREKALVDHEIKMIRYQETKYENRSELGNQNRMIELENLAQEKLIKTMEKAIEESRKQMKSVKKDSDDWKNLYDNILSCEEAIEEANQAIEDNTRKIKENEKAILKLHTDLEQTVDTEIKNRIQRQRDMLAGTVSMEDIILEAVRQRYRDEWELIQKDVEKKKQALEEEKNLIDERLQRRKDAEDEAEKYEELSEYKKQLALIQMDSTRTKDAAKLREQIAKLEKDIAWDVAEDEANYQKEQIDDQLQAYDDFITYGSEDLEDWLSDANNMVEEVSGVMKMTQEDMMQWLEDNVKDYVLALDDSQKQMIEGWTDTYKQMLGITDTFWDDINDILTGKTIFLEYMSKSQDYLNASEDDQKIMMQDWEEMYDNWIAARRRDAVYSHSDDDLNGLGGSSRSGGGGGGGGKATPYEYAPPELDESPGTTTAMTKSNKPESNAQNAANPGSVASLINNVSTSMANAITSIVDYILPTKAYASGGLVDFTGPAWVDGTKMRPEAFLDAEDTALMRSFLDDAKYVRFRSSISNIDSSNFNGSSQNIGELVINITEAQFKDDADFDEVAQRVGDKFVKELAKQGFNTMSYSF